jgi:hypothetical protein
VAGGRVFVFAEDETAEHSWEIVGEGGEADATAGAGGSDGDDGSA